MTTTRLARVVRAGLLTAALLLGAASLSACNDIRPPMLQPVAPVPDVTSTS